MTPIQGVTQVKSPEQVPDGPHFLVVLFTSKEVMVDSGGWESELKRTQLPITELYVTTNQDALAQLAQELHGQQYSILFVSAKGQRTQAIQFG